MNYIIKLSFSNEYNVIYIYIDRFMKMTHFCSITIEVTSEEIVNLYFQYIFKYHDLLINIISNKNPQFTSKFITKLLELLDIKENKSIIFHS